MTLDAFALSVVSSVLGALVVYAIGWGKSVTTTTWQSRRRALKDELERWLSGDLAVRQAITDLYLFRILRTLFLASAAWVMPDVIANAAQARYTAFPLQEGNHFVDVAIPLFCCISNAVAAGFFIYGLGIITRYSRLRSLQVEAAAGQMR